MWVTDVHRNSPRVNHKIDALELVSRILRRIVIVVAKWA